MSVTVLLSHFVKKEAHIVLLSCVEQTLVLWLKHIFGLC